MLSGDCCHLHVVANSPSSEGTGRCCVRVCCNTVDRMTAFHLDQHGPIPGSNPPWTWATSSGPRICTNRSGRVQTTGCCVIQCACLMNRQIFHSEATVESPDIRLVDSHPETDRGYNHRNSSVHPVRLNLGPEVSLQPSMVGLGRNTFTRQAPSYFATSFSRPTVHNSTPSLILQHKTTQSFTNTNNPLKS